MRGLRTAPPRLSAARAFLAGAAILAGAATSVFSPARAQDVSEDTALAIPRLSPGAPSGSDGVGLPRPLSSAQARLLREAFRDAAMPLDAVRDSPLLGHILAERLSVKAGMEELRTWLARYPDLPDAPAFHAQLVARLPRGVRPPPPPALPAFTATPFGDDIEAQGSALSRSPALDRTVREAIRSGQFEAAERVVQRTRGITPEYGALLRAEVAQALFGQGRDREALAMAEAANRQAHGAVGLAPWIGGLAAWRLGRPELARTWFEAAWRAPLNTPGHRAGGAWWAARAMLVTRGDHGVWMRRAAREPRTFYGLLARRMLGQSIRTPADPPGTLGQADIDAVAALPRGERAFALLQVGQPGRAAAELRVLWTEMRDQPGFGRSVLVVARAAGLAELSGQLEAAMQPATVRLPTAKLRPAGGFRLDAALVHALARLESNFDPDAVSRAGARGLMQLMPGTAKFVLAGNGPVHGAPKLHDPATNLDIGQRYLLQLSGRESVGTDLIRLLAAYNAGPGNFLRWIETMPAEQDPLLFIESLPGDETRAYVPRALAYTWLYAAQLGLPSPTLDELAAGLWPTLQTRTGRRDAAVRLH